MRLPAVLGKPRPKVVNIALVPGFEKLKIFDFQLFKTWRRHRCEVHGDILLKRERENGIYYKSKPFFVFCISAFFAKFCLMLGVMAGIKHLA